MNYVSDPEDLDPVSAAALDRARSVFAKKTPESELDAELRESAERARAAFAPKPLPYLDDLLLIWPVVAAGRATMPGGVAHILNEHGFRESEWLRDRNGRFLKFVGFLPKKKGKKKQKKPNWTQNEDGTETPEFQTAKVFTRPDSDEVASYGRVVTPLNNQKQVVVEVGDSIKNLGRGPEPTPEEIAKMPVGMPDDLKPGETRYIRVDPKQLEVVSDPLTKSGGRAELPDKAAEAIGLGANDPDDTPDNPFDDLDPEEAMALESDLDTAADAAEKAGEDEEAKALREAADYIGGALETGEMDEQDSSLQAAEDALRSLAEVSDDATKARLTELADRVDGLIVKQPVSGEPYERWTPPAKGNRAVSPNDEFEQSISKLNKREQNRRRRTREEEQEAAERPFQMAKNRANKLPAGSQRKNTHKSVVDAIDSARGAVDRGLLNPGAAAQMDRIADDIESGKLEFDKNLAPELREIATRLRPAEGTRTADDDLADKAVDAMAKMGPAENAREHRADLNNAAFALANEPTDERREQLAIAADKAKRGQSAPVQKALDEVIADAGFAPEAGPEPKKRANLDRREKRANIATEPTPEEGGDQGDGTTGESGGGGEVSADAQRRGAIRQSLRQAASDGGLWVDGGAGSDDSSAEPGVARTLRMSPEQAAEFKELTGRDPRAFNELNQGQESADRFHEALMAGKISNPYGAMVTAYDPEEYAGDNVRMFLSDDGQSGFALRDGDIISVFNAADGPKGATSEMLPLAIQEGGNRLDAFDAGLGELYGSFGFKASARMPFNEEYKPDDWDLEKLNHPDVLFMHLDPSGKTGTYKKGDGEYVDDYDEGLRRARVDAGIEEAPAAKPKEVAALEKKAREAKSPATRASAARALADHYRQQGNTEEAENWSNYADDIDNSAIRNKAIGAAESLGDQWTEMDDADKEALIGELEKIYRENPRRTKKQAVAAAQKALKEAGSGGDTTTSSDETGTGGDQGGVPGQGAGGTQGESGAGQGVAKPFANKSEAFDVPTLPQELREPSRSADMDQLGRVNKAIQEQGSTYGEMPPRALQAEINRRADLLEADADGFLEPDKIREHVQKMRDHANRVGATADMLEAARKESQSRPQEEGPKPKPKPPSGSTPAPEPEGKAPEPYGEAEAAVDAEALNSDRNLFDEKMGEEFDAVQKGLGSTDTAELDRAKLGANRIRRAADRAYDDIAKVDPELRTTRDRERQERAKAAAERAGQLEAFFADRRDAGKREAAAKAPTRQRFEARAKELDEGLDGLAAAHPDLKEPADAFRAALNDEDLKKSDPGLWARNAAYAARDLQDGIDAKIAAGDDSEDLVVASEVAKDAARRGRILAKRSSERLPTKRNDGKHQPAKMPWRSMPIAQGKVAEDLVDENGDLDTEKVEKFLNEGDYTAFDLETTGLNIDPLTAQMNGGTPDRPVSASLIKYKDGKEVDRKTFELNPGKPVGSSEKVHGISDEQAAQGQAWQEALPEMIEFIGPDTVMAHNAHYDMTMLRDMIDSVMDPNRAHEHPEGMDLEPIRQQLRDLGVTGKDYMPEGGIFDTLPLAQAMHKARQKTDGPAFKKWAKENGIEYSDPDRSKAYKKRQDALKQWAEAGAPGSTAPINSKLDGIAPYFGITREGPHKADQDVADTVEAMKRYLASPGEKPESLGNAAELEAKYGDDERKLPHKVDRMRRADRVQADKDVVPDDSVEALIQDFDERTGTAFDPATGTIPTEGYAVSRPGHARRYDGTEFSRANAATFIDDNWDELQDNPNAHAVFRTDPDTGEVVADIVDVYDNPEDARKAADENGTRNVVDLSTMQAVPEPDEDDEETPTPESGVGSKGTHSGLPGNGNYTVVGEPVDGWAQVEPDDPQGAVQGKQTWYVDGKGNAVQVHDPEDPDLDPTAIGYLPDGQEVMPESVGFTRGAKPDETGGDAPSDADWELAKKYVPDFEVMDPEHYDPILENIRDARKRLPADASDEDVIKEANKVAKEKWEAKQAAKKKQEEGESGETGETGETGESGESGETGEGGETGDDEAGEPTPEGPSQADYDLVDRSAPDFLLEDKDLREQLAKDVQEARKRLPDDASDDAIMEEAARIRAEREPGGGMEGGEGRTPEETEPSGPTPSDDGGSGPGGPPPGGPGGDESDEPTPPSGPGGGGTPPEAPEKPEPSTADYNLARLKMGPRLDDMDEKEQKKILEAVRDAREHLGEGATDDEIWARARKALKGDLPTDADYDFARRRLGPQFDRLSPKDRDTVAEWVMNAQRKLGTRVSEEEIWKEVRTNLDKKKTSDEIWRLFGDNRGTTKPPMDPEGVDYNLAQRLHEKAFGKGTWKDLTPQQRAEEARLAMAVRHSRGGQRRMQGPPTGNRYLNESDRPSRATAEEYRQRYQVPRDERLAELQRAWEQGRPGGRPSGGDGGSDGGGGGTPAATPDASEGGEAPESGNAFNEFNDAIGELSDEAQVAHQKKMVDALTELDEAFTEGDNERVAKAFDNIAATYDEIADGMAESGASEENIAKIRALAEEARGAAAGFRAESESGESGNASPDGNGEAGEGGETGEGGGTEGAGEADGETGETSAPETGETPTPSVPGQGSETPSGDEESGNVPEPVIPSVPSQGSEEPSVAEEPDNGLDPEVIERQFEDAISGLDDASKDEHREVFRDNLQNLVDAIDDGDEEEILNAAQDLADHLNQVAEEMGEGGIFDSPSENIDLIRDMANGLRGERSEEDKRRSVGAMQEGAVEAYNDALDIAEMLEGAGSSLAAEKIRRLADELEDAWQDGNWGAVAQIQRDLSDALKASDKSLPPESRAHARDVAKTIRPKPQSKRRERTKGKSPAAKNPDESPSANQAVDNLDDAITEAGDGADNPAVQDAVDAVNSVTDDDGNITGNSHELSDASVRLDQAAQDAQNQGDNSEQSDNVVGAIDDAADAVEEEADKAADSEAGDPDAPPRVPLPENLPDLPPSDIVSPEDLEHFNEASNQANSRYTDARQRYEDAMRRGDENAAADAMADMQQALSDLAAEMDASGNDELMAQARQLRTQSRKIGAALRKAQFPRTRIDRRNQPKARERRRLAMERKREREARAAERRRARDRAKGWKKEIRQGRREVDQNRKREAKMEQRKDDSARKFAAQKGWQRAGTGEDGENEVYHSPDGQWSLGKVNGAWELYNLQNGDMYQFDPDDPNVARQVRDVLAGKRDPETWPGLDGGDESGDSGGDDSGGGGGDDGEPPPSGGDGGAVAEEGEQEESPLPEGERPTELGGDYQPVVQELPLENGKTSPIFNYFGRPVVLVDIGGVKVPFYQSTGKAPKDGVVPGQWYPFMGIGTFQGGWLNKTYGLEDYYGNDVLRDVAERLDAQYGDLRNDPDLPEVDGAWGDPTIKALNEGFAVPPSGRPTPDAIDGVVSNRQDMLEALEQAFPGSNQPDHLYEMQKRAAALEDKRDKPRVDAFLDDYRHYMINGNWDGARDALDRAERSANARELSSDEQDVLDQGVNLANDLMNSGVEAESLWDANTPEELREAIENLNLPDDLPPGIAAELDRVYRRIDELVPRGDRRPEVTDEDQRPAASPNGSERSTDPKDAPAAARQMQESADQVESLRGRDLNQQADELVAAMDAVNPKILQWKNGKWDFKDTDKTRQDVASRNPNAKETKRDGIINRIGSREKSALELALQTNDMELRKDLIDIARRAKALRLDLEKELKTEGGERATGWRTGMTERWDKVNALMSRTPIGAGDGSRWMYMNDYEDVVDYDPHRKELEDVAEELKKITNEDNWKSEYSGTGRLLNNAYMDLMRMLLGDTGEKSDFQREDRFERIISALNRADFLGPDGQDKVAGLRDRLLAVRRAAHPQDVDTGEWDMSNDDIKVAEDALLQFMGEGSELGQMMIVAHKALKDARKAPQGSDDRWAALARARNALDLAHVKEAAPIMDALSVRIDENRLRDMDDPTFTLNENNIAPSRPAPRGTDWSLSEIDAVNELAANIRQQAGGTKLKDDQRGRAASLLEAATKAFRRGRYGEFETFYDMAIQAAMAGGMKDAVNDLLSRRTAHWGPLDNDRLRDDLAEAMTWIDHLPKKSPRSADKPDARRRREAARGLIEQANNETNPERARVLLSTALWQLRQANVADDQKLRETLSPYDPNGDVRPSNFDDPGDPDLPSPAEPSLPPVVSRSVPLAAAQVAFRNGVLGPGALSSVFPGMTRDQARKVLDDLVDRGVMFKSKFNSDSYHLTNDAWNNANTKDLAQLIAQGVQGHANVRFGVPEGTTVHAPDPAAGTELASSAPPSHAQVAAAMSPEAVQATVQKMVTEHGGTREGAMMERGQGLGDTAVLQHVGYLGKPMAVSAEEFDKIQGLSLDRYMEVDDPEFDTYDPDVSGPLRGGSIPLVTRDVFYRGMERRFGRGGPELAARFIYDEPDEFYVGDGVRGSGIYIGSEANAERFADAGFGAARGPSRVTDDHAILRMKLKPGTRIVDWADIPESVRRAYESRGDSMAVYEWALANGYHGINGQKQVMDQWVGINMLDRSQIIVELPPLYSAETLLAERMRALDEKRWAKQRRANDLR